ncbi:MAG: hypothetical protein CMA41_04235 [Euryarchaeota archaeon]|nr:hypothetical protein [Euryarchaeota archaeon]|tara:strand:+ start:2506 stop:4269 length:1764 start_codon:yes stop_codon:yes gene_type:complete
MLWGDIDEAIKAERLLRIQRIERLSTICALFCLSGAVWLAWPVLKDAFVGDASLLTGLGMPVLVLVWGIVIQDLILDDPRARTRIGAASSVIWPVLLMFALRAYSSSTVDIIATVIFIGLGYTMYQSSANILRGGIDVMRFRAMMTGIGALTVLGMLVGDRAGETWIVETEDWTHPILSAVILVHVAYLWIAGDDMREERKAFRKELDSIENRLLVLRSQGAAVDQASSLVMTAKEEGHIDPSFGMRLLLEAAEDIERSLSLATDVDVVRNEALIVIQHAEELAPLAKRPRKSYEMGEREVTLGSLREAEGLFRQAKRRAQEIVTWWAQAEESIRTAEELLTGQSGATIDNLRQLIRDAKKQLDREAPKKAFELACVIPIQLQADGDARERAVEVLSDAAKALKAADGFDTSELEQRLDQAESALEAGDTGQSIGLAEGVIRVIQIEREAMDSVRRALRQRKKITERFESFADAEEWMNRFKQVQKAADERQWSHAATLLERLTIDLDALGNEQGEAQNLLDFVRQEWKVLRNQCNASSISVTDEDMKKTEAAISLAEERLNGGQVEAALEQLGQADASMERLRRRV